MSVQPCDQLNGDTNDGPTLWSTPTYEVGLVSDDADPLNIGCSIVKRTYASPLTWTSFNLASIPGNPLWLPVNVVTSPGVMDTHYKFVCMVDSAGFIHVSGNQHQSPRKYVKSTVAGDITTLADASSLVDNSATGVTTGLGTDNNGGFSYNKFEIDHHGNRWWYFLQSDRTTAPKVAGRDAILMMLPYNPSATWSQPWEYAPGTVNGEIQTCNETVSDGDPERVYTCGFMFRPADDLMGWFGVWQDAHDDGNTRGELFYVQREYGSSQWKTITGTNVTSPFQRADIQAQGAQLPDQVDPINSDWRPCFDSSGYPHIVVSDGGANVRHHWWDGSAWQYETTPGGGGGGGHLVMIGNQMWRTRVTANAYYMYPMGSPSAPFRVRLSGTVPNTFSPLPDPVGALGGKISVMSPYGNQPRVFSFGANAKRAKA